MGVHSTTVAALAEPERAEIEAIVAEAIAARPGVTARFVSDEGDAMAWVLLAAVAALCGLVAIVVMIATAFDPAALLVVPRTPLGLLHAPTIPGLVVSVGVLVYAGVTFARVHHRHGTMATSFGIVRLRGQRAVVLRYGDIAQAVRRRVGTRRPFSVLELQATNGTTMTTYATRIMDAIQARVPPTAVNVRPT